VKNCVFSDCVGEFSGGAFMIWAGAAPVITDCKFEGNETWGFASGAVGGGFFISPTFERCTFINNNSLGGSGAIGVGFGAGDPTVITIDECHFEGNQASGPWGALGVGFGASGYVTDCTFVNNHAGNTGGAAGCPEYAYLELTGCTFAGNSSDFGGGAVGFYLGSTGVLRGCTLFGNSAPVGGGVLVETASDAVTLENTIVSFSTMGEAVGGPGTVTLACCDVFGNAGGDFVGLIADQLGVSGNISLDPLFEDPEDGEFYLDEDSPCAPFTPPNEQCDLIGAWPSEDDDDQGEDAHASQWASLRFSGGILSTQVTGTGTQIRYAVPQGARVNLTVYDASGRTVRRLLDEEVSSGVHTAIWNGRDDSGLPVASGIYLSKMRIDGRHQDSGKVSLVR
jgi:hypothetical protein